MTWLISPSGKHRSTVVLIPGSLLRGLCLMGGLISGTWT